MHLSTLFVAVAALSAGARAATPCPLATRGQLHCGSALVNVYNCISATELRTFTNPDWDVLETIYTVEADGSVDTPVEVCPVNCVDQTGGDAYCA